MKSAEFKKLVLNECDTAFKSKGFNVPRKNCILYPLNDEFFGWVGLNVAASEGVVKINPFIGLHSPAIAETKANLLNQKYKLGDIATYAVHLGTVLPDVKAFVFDVDKQEDVKIEANRLVKIILEFGLPYAKSIASYTELLPLLQQKIEMLGGFPESYAVALFRSDRHEQCVEFLTSHAKTIEQYGESIVKPFQEFSDSLTKLLEK